MILSDREIREALRQKKIQIDPPPTEEQYTTSKPWLIYKEFLAIELQSQSSWDNDSGYKSTKPPS